jgi:glycine dehydrogenase subunit 1
MRPGGTTGVDGHREAGAHPYFAGSAAAEREGMLEALGLGDVSDLYAAVPERLRLSRPLDLPAPLTSEHDLARHFADTLADDRITPPHRCFRGAGCAPHVVPEICREVVNRAEFRTAYWGNQYTDHGKYQAFFEYASLMGELLEMDAVSLPTYDWGNAAAVSVRMAARITGRRRVVVAGHIGSERAAIVSNYCEPEVSLLWCPIDQRTGGVDLAALESLVDGDTAGVYVEQPSYLGTIDPHISQISAQAHDVGALLIAGVDPISLGVLASPSALGADIACGDLQPLGVGMHFGGGLAGFVASADTEQFVSEYPTYLIGRTPTTEQAEHGFGLVAWERTSYVRRELGKDFSGTTTATWAIAAATFLALAGPLGMREIGRGIMQRARYAATRLATVAGVTAPIWPLPHFKEFVINVDATGVTLAELNEGLRTRGFLGPRDLSAELRGLGESGLVCVTETHSKEDIDAFVEAVREAVASP